LRQPGYLLREASSPVRLNLISNDQNGCCSPGTPPWPPSRHRRRRWGPRKRNRQRTKQSEI